MFMTTTLAHYQLPVLQLASVGIATDIGGNPRSIFVQPITAMSPQTELPPSQVVTAAAKTTLPFAFKDWLQRLQDYEANAARARPTAMAAAEPAAHPAAAAAAAEVTPALPSLAAAASSAETAPTGEEPTATSVSEQTTTPATSTGAGGLTGLVKALLR